MAIGRLRLASPAPSSQPLIANDAFSSGDSVASSQQRDERRQPIDVVVRHLDGNLLDHRRRKTSLVGIGDRRDCRAQRLGDLFYPCGFRLVPRQQLTDLHKRFTGDLIHRKTCQQRLHKPVLARVAAQLKLLEQRRSRLPTQLAHFLFQVGQRGEFLDDPIRAPR